MNATRERLPAQEIQAQGEFQWAPTLGGECYLVLFGLLAFLYAIGFQWAPTLGGECYGTVYLITPPFCQGVNALLNNQAIVNSTLCANLGAS